MSKLSRFLESIDYLRDNGVARTQQAIATAMSANRVNIAKAMKGESGYFTDSFLKRFAAAYSDYIREEWLLTGEGDMAVPDPALRPHFDASASAGFLDGFDPSAPGHEMRPLDSSVPAYDFTITADGDSMTPLIHSGDTLCCLLLEDRANPPVGRICVIDSPDGKAVKQIVRVTRSSVTLHSLNPAYTDITLPAADIRHVAIVVALTRTL